MKGCKQLVPRAPNDSSLFFSCIISVIELASPAMDFLLLLFKQQRIDAKSLEKAIEIAGSKSPSASFDIAGVYTQTRGWDQMTSLTYAKGVRWLAIILRDQGANEFDKTAEKMFA